MRYENLSLLCWPTKTNARKTKWTVTEYASIISHTTPTQLCNFCHKKQKTNTPTHTNRTTAATFAIAARHQPTTTTTTTNQPTKPTTTNQQQQLLLLLQICNQLCNQQHNNNKNNNNHHPQQQQQRRNQIKPHLNPKMQNKNKTKKQKKKQQQPTNVFPGLSRILARRLQTGRVGVPVRASAGECREARRWFDNGLHGRRKGQMRTWPLPLLSSPPAPTGTIKSGPNTRHRCRCCSCGMAISIFTLYFLLLIPPPPSTCLPPSHLLRPPIIPLILSNLIFPTHTLPSCPLCRPFPLC